VRRSIIRPIMYTEHTRYSVNVIRECLLFGSWSVVVCGLSMRRVLWLNGRLYQKYIMRLISPV